MMSRRDARACISDKSHHGCVVFIIFFFNDTATTEIYTLSLHDALPICPREIFKLILSQKGRVGRILRTMHRVRSEEHTSELQSQSNLVCRLLLEKKKSIMT